MKSMLKQIREKYQTPVKALYGEGYYCVGGALCLFIGGNISYPSDAFPGETALARALRSVNKNLSEDAAIMYARRIISDNDSGYFDDAWETLGRALSFGGA